MAKFVLTSEITLMTAIIFTDTVDKLYVVYWEELSP